MDHDHAEIVGKRLAYQFGDLRDWPIRCGWCGSEAVSPTLTAAEHWLCGECRRLTSREVAAEFQDLDARHELFSEPPAPRRP